VDIKDAENIFGTNVGSLKGKTVTRKGLTDTVLTISEQDQTQI